MTPIEEVYLQWKKLSHCDLMLRVYWPKFDCSISKMPDTSLSVCYTPSLPICYTHPFPCGRGVWREGIGGSWPRQEEGGRDRKVAKTGEGSGGHF